MIGKENNNGQNSGKNMETTFVSCDFCGAKVEISIQHLDKLMQRSDFLNAKLICSKCYPLLLPTPKHTTVRLYDEEVF